MTRRVDALNAVKYGEMSGIDITATDRIDDVILHALKVLPSPKVIRSCNDAKALTHLLECLKSFDAWRNGIIDQLKAIEGKPVEAVTTVTPPRFRLDDQLPARQYLIQMRNTLPSEETLTECKDLDVLMNWLETWRIMETWIATLNHRAETLAIEAGNTPEAKAKRAEWEARHPLPPVQTHDDKPFKPPVGTKYIAKMNTGDVAGFKGITEARKWAEGFGDKADDCRITTRSGELVARHRRMVGTPDWISIPEGWAGFDDDPQTNLERAGAA